ncbi:MAG: serine/threonine-protein kinase, partial [bacterium]|nr:serine/threonine-protein kinase [bacterium]
SGIESIHSYGIIHRDIKPANIMLYYKANNKLSIKIIDFEFSEETLQAGQCKGPVMGTLEYMAPEILTGQKYGTSVDIWASGVILYEMLLNSIPFYNDFIEASLINRAVKNAVLNVTIPFHYTKKEKRIIVYNIKRAKVNSRVFSLFKTENKEAYNLLMGKTCEKYKFIFNQAPSKRITATEMKCHEYIKDLCEKENDKMRNIFRFFLKNNEANIGK